MIMVQESNEKLLEHLYEIEKTVCKLIKMVEEDSEEFNERRGRRNYRMNRYNERYNERYDY